MTDPNQEPLAAAGNIFSKLRDAIVALLNAFKERYSKAWQVLKILFKPIAIILWPFIRAAKWLWRVYVNRVFRRYSYRDGELQPKRAALVIALTLAFLVLMYFSVKPISNLIRDIYHVQTAQEVTLYFGKPSYNSDLHLYQVTACKSKTSCEGGDNALIFDIPDNSALDIMYTFTRAKGYDPEHEIVSAFNSEYQKCTVQSKGSRPIIINYFFGTYKWHPKIIDTAICTPVVNMQ